MFATLTDSKDLVITLSPSIAAELTKGYKVRLHDPRTSKYTFRVDAATLDDAHRAVLQFCHHSTHMLTTTGATIQRIRD